MPKKRPRSSPPPPPLPVFRKPTAPPAPPAPPPRKKRQSTLYDAVAGRINSHGFIPTSPSQLLYHSSRTTTTSSLHPIPPEEVLFSRKNAPPRYEEDDPYFPTFKTHAEEKRVMEDLLPDGELCAALHAYAADYYGALGRGKEGRDFKSMDETALLALGVLVEEMAGAVLGECGEGVFVEGDEHDSLLLQGRQSVLRGNRLGRARKGTRRDQARPRTRATLPKSGQEKSEGGQEEVGKRKRMKVKVKAPDEHDVDDE